MSGAFAFVERVLPATCEVVYDEWLSADALTDWMCPRPARLRAVDIDPVVGGRLRLDIVEDGKELLVLGTYLTLDRPRTIRFTWSCSTWPEPLQESIVTVELRPSGATDTLMTIRHELIPPDTASTHSAGWEAVGNQLAARLSRQPAG
jgi:uncharacterized protein YndB with AHSA1/START domain